MVLKTADDVKFGVEGSPEVQKVYLGSPSGDILVWSRPLAAAPDITVAVGYTSFEGTAYGYISLRWNNTIPIEDRTEAIIAKYWKTDVMGPSVTTELLYGNAEQIMTVVTYERTDEPIVVDVSAMFRDANGDVGPESTTYRVTINPIPDLKTMGVVVSAYYSWSCSSKSYECMCTVPASMFSAKQGYVYFSGSDFVGYTINVEDFRKNNTTGNYYAYTSNTTHVNVSSGGGSAAVDYYYDGAKYGTSESDGGGGCIPT